MKIELITKKNIPPPIKRNIKKITKIIPLRDFKEIYIRFVNSDEIKMINSKIFKKKSLTDVITISYDHLPHHKIGEIFICLDAAKENAKKFSISYSTEILILLIHGFLHLKGYDDKTPNEFKRINKTTLKKLKKLL